MNTQPRPIELLTPARNAKIGMEAIRCGADAVYIGATRFGARAEAGNNMEDIAQLANYAHLFGAKVYITLNTILYENELETAHLLVEDLAKAGADGLITQDTALLEMDLPLPLHASTQMDNRTPKQIQFLSDCGFKRVILARELNIKEIEKIHTVCPKIELEVFIHGALCVSFSGKCYASQYCFGRSANRGECAQFCRLAFDLEDADGKKLIKDKYLLSLRDMNRSNALEELMDAGVCSFKIEGRLKDISYVKNTTAFYRQEIDSILHRRKEYTRASWGNSKLNFIPNVRKSFNRGFTEYFLHGQTNDIFSFKTPKAIGESVGEVKEIKGNIIKVAGLASFNNGDGLCYFDTEGKLHGFRVNRVENNVLFLSASQKNLKQHTSLFRNHDESFEHSLTHCTTERTLAVDMLLREISNGFQLTMKDESGLSISLFFDYKKEEAHTLQKERQIAELSKMGGTCFCPNHINISLSHNYFLPASVLAAWRRKAIKELSELHLQKMRDDVTQAVKTVISFPTSNHFCGHYTYETNVSNSMARNFYLKHGATEVDTAFELSVPPESRLMSCKHCLRFALGACNKQDHATKISFMEPLYLALPNGKRFRLSFDCSQCQMNVYASTI